MNLQVYSVKYLPSKFGSYLILRLRAFLKTNMHHFKLKSRRYGSKTLKFGKIDVARSPKLVEKYNIVTSVTSRTLPTLIMFKDGREYMRRPLLDSRQRVVPFSFSFVSSYPEQALDILLSHLTDLRFRFYYPQKYQENIASVFSLETR